MSIRTLFLAIALAAFIAPASAQLPAQSPAQSPAIQPCEATPTPAKPGGANAPAKVGVRSAQTSIDASIPDDPEIEKLLAPYSGKVRALSAVIGRLDQPLKKESVGAGSLGNFVTDGIRSFAHAKLKKPIALVIMNAGGLRKNEIAAGELRATDVFELLPFENALVAVEVTGADLAKLLPAVVRDAQSGARLQYKWNDQNRPEFLSGKLIGDNGQEQEVDPNKIYTVVTIDYLLKVGGGAYAILKEAKSVVPLNITLRDAIMEYVKAETAAGRIIRAPVDDRYVQVGPGPKARPEEPR
ncbi:MAG TPA: 5'-nucleotidase C-terminal domain-containing protein [Pyrinomonadaceae bacterium]|nr:5'-nucleotidase C-terminal domain-containing protein [Pyrinomonadaceae bacterium]